ncbi:MAG TPA: hypothetical protein PKD51_16040 [Saprospiraceae bacterium]|nr:hypothetical protein [Saprospiraceae bacterium]
MNRRKFLGISGISLIGSNSLVMSVSSVLGIGSEDKVFDIFSFLGVNKTGKIDNLKFNKIILDQLKIWQKSNYQLCDDNIYWIAGKDQILIPIQLKTSDDKILDNVVLVFYITEDQSPKYTGNLSSFHIEAISRNTKLLDELGDTEIIRESILPYTGKGRPVDLGWSFDTKLGSFELSASLSDGKTSISSALYVDKKAIWQSSFLSESQLVQSFSATI